jgi:glycosyltransferase involved in cell wall biosynthesis
MRVLIFTQYFWPENFRINDLVQELSNRGHKITVITGLPNYPSGNLHSDYKKKPNEFSNYFSAKIIRVPIVLRGNGNLFRLFLNYISYVLSGSIAAWRLRKFEFDLVFVYEPSPITVCLPAIFFKSLTKTPIIFWVLDLWPETLKSLKIINSSFILSIVGKLVSFIYNRCDLILGQSRSFESEINKYSFNQLKFRYFPSWSEDLVEESSYKNLPILSNDNNFFKIVFTGNIGKSQDFESILLAAEILKSSNIKAKFLIFGDGRMKNDLENQILSKGLKEQIQICGLYPLSAMPSIYHQSDALLATLKATPAFEKTIPGKIQSYMLSSRPILTMLSGEGSRIIDDAKCGLTANSGDFLKLIENIKILMELNEEDRNKMGLNGRSYSEVEFNRKSLIDRLEKWFLEIKSI